MQPDSSPPSPKRSTSGKHGCSPPSLVNVPISQGPIDDKHGSDVEEPLLDTVGRNSTHKSSGSFQDTQPKTLATVSEPSSTFVDGVPNVQSIGSDYQDLHPAQVPSLSNGNSDLGVVNNYTTASHHEFTNESDSSDDEFLDAKEDDSENKKELVATVENCENNNSRLAGEGDLQGLLPSFSPVCSPSPLMSDDEHSAASSTDSNCTVIKNNILNKKEPLLSTQDIQTKTSATGSDGQSDENQQMNYEKAGSINTPGIPEQILVPINSDTKTDDKQSANSNNVSVTVPSVQSAPPKSVDKSSGKEDTQSKSTRVHLVANKNSEQVNNAQVNSKQPSYPGKNNPAPQNTKSKLPVIAASMLAITGVATGIAIAVYLEMLAVGIAVGVCCLLAAAIIYYCNRPSHSLENSSAEVIVNQGQNYNSR